MLSRARRVTGVIVTAVSFQVLWYLLVSSAGRPLSLWAAAITIVGMAVAVTIFTETPGRSLMFLALAVALGGLMDTGLTVAGCITPVRAYLPDPIPPVWLIGLWVGFAGFARISLRYLCGRPLVQFAAGFFGGPAAYFGGVKLDAVVVHPNILLGYGLLALCWGLACIVLFSLSCRLHRTTDEDEE